MLIIDRSLLRYLNLELFKDESVIHVQYTDQICEYTFKELERLVRIIKKEGREE